MKTMKVSRCVQCRGLALPTVRHTFRATIAGVSFERRVSAQKCSSCGEVYLSAGVLGDFELSAALAIARAGVCSPAALKFMRKAAGLRAADLGELLGLTPEHLSRIENGKVPADKRTVALLAALLEDSAAKTTRTVDQLRVIDHPRKLKGKVRLSDVAAPLPSIVRHRDRLHRSVAP
jgi:YgiT-type zinc finger domain-containing protein